jgi:hypothetical protein
VLSNALFLTIAAVGGYLLRFGVATPASAMVSPPCTWRIVRPVDPARLRGFPQDDVSTVRWRSVRKAPPDPARAGINLEPPVLVGDGDLTVSTRGKHWHVASVAKRALRTRRFGADARRQSLSRARHFDCAGRPRDGALRQRSFALSRPCSGAVAPPTAADHGHAAPIDPPPSTQDSPPPYAGSADLLVPADLQLAHKFQTPQRPTSW